ncbi:Uncharacterised protein [Salmonella enterica subsp. enterica]|uniref:Uncharacterized protein n=1 Tax=Salmonella enterica I TaxID=59201 RepID=A0A379WVL8_SALET|nr:Uncharacterised protein [Salmonella enterica subsp. enterica]
MKLQSRVVSVAFRAAAIKTFGTLWIKFRFTLQTRHQIRVSDVIATKRHGVNQPFFDQIFRFFWRIAPAPMMGPWKRARTFSRNASLYGSPPAQSGSDICR